MNLLIERFHPLLENVSNDEWKLNSDKYVAEAWLSEENGDLSKRMAIKKSSLMCQFLQRTSRDDLR